MGIVNFGPLIRYPGTSLEEALAEDGDLWLAAAAPTARPSASLLLSDEISSDSVTCTHSMRR